jgi:transcriptional regulator CtsR
VESRRGGGGFIKIKKIQSDTNGAILKLINEKVSDSITCDSAYNIIDVLVERELITDREANIMKVAINDRVLVAPAEQKNAIRAQILRAMIKIILL